MRDKEVNKWLRAAAQRLAAARILFHDDRYLDCMYLAGYAPECALKALILSRVHRHTREKFIQDHFRGAYTHNYEYLKGILKKNWTIGIPPEISRMFQQIATWSTDLRYEVKLRERREAQEFLKSAETILNWVERSL